MDYPKLYRKRLIPSECILLKDDHILVYNDDIILTSWNTLHPRTDFDHGFSCYFRNKNIKVSRFLHPDGSLCKWYCDIVDYETVLLPDSITVVDLLADVIVEPDGFVKVMDLDELSQAFSLKLISLSQLQLSLYTLNQLLEHIYNDDFFNIILPIFAPYDSTL